MRTAGIDLPKKNTRQEVRRYLDSHLKSHLGLRNIQMLDGHNQNALANSDHGALLLKFFREDVAHRASRSVLSNTLLAEHGVATPELVYADPRSAVRIQALLCGDPLGAGRAAAAG